MPRKLGQHFLKNKIAITKIIAALDLKDGDTIIEIGPGRGELTLPLSEMFEVQNVRGKIIAIEKDRELVMNHSSRIKHRTSDIELIHGDALKIIPDITKRLTLAANRFKLVGNIPYYITGKLLRVISELENKSAVTVLMIQKEVAERIVAQPPKMNLLAAITQFWAEPKILMTLKPSDFDPAPKVESAIIKFLPKTDNLNAKHYYALVRIIFKQPRKTLLNNLSDGLEIGKKEILEKLRESGFNEKTRPQELNVEQIRKLSIRI